MGQTVSVILTKFLGVAKNAAAASKPNLLALTFDATDGGQVVLQTTQSAAAELMAGLQQYERVHGFQ